LTIIDRCERIDVSGRERARETEMTESTQRPPMRSPGTPMPFDVAEAYAELDRLLAEEATEAELKE
jgi:hypothetical protein